MYHYRLLLEAICSSIYNCIYRHKTCELVGVFDVDVLVDGVTIVCWSRRCWGWKNSKRFGVDFKLKIRFVVGEFEIVGWLGRKTCRVKCELRSFDGGEKAIEWENCVASCDDGERQFDE